MDADVWIAWIALPLRAQSRALGRRYATAVHKWMNQAQTIENHVFLAATMTLPRALVLPRPDLHSFIQIFY